MSSSPFLFGTYTLLACVGLSTPAVESPLPEPVAPLDDVALLDAHLWAVTVSRRPQPIARSPQSVEVLKLDDWMLSGAATIPDLLRYQPGVDVYQARHGQFDIGMRGFNGLNTPRTLALVDGRAFSWQTIGAVPWVGYVHSSDIDRIEVVKGPASVTYGANAFGGIVAFTTQRYLDRWRATTVNGLGSHGLVEVDATAGGPFHTTVDGTVVYGKASAGYSAREDLPATTGAIQNAGYPRTGRSGEDDLVAKRFAATAGVHFDDDLTLELDWRFLDVDEFEMIEDLSPGSNLVVIEQHALGARVEGPWFEFDHERIWFDLEYHNQSVAYDPLQDFSYIQAGAHDVKDTSRVQFNVDIDDHHLGLGSEYTHYRSESNAWADDGRFEDESTWREVVVENLAAYAEHQWRPDRNWTTSAGLRFDDHDLVGTNFSPRLAINRRLGDEGFARLSFLSGYRLPAPIETYVREYFFTIDDDIEAETIQSVDLEWQGRIDPLHCSFTGFFNRANDALFFVPRSNEAMRQAWLDAVGGWMSGDFRTQPGPFFELSNIDNPVSVYGIEAEAEWRVDEHLQLWLNGTWQYFRYRDRIRFANEGFVDPTSGDTIFAFDYVLPRDVNAPPEWKANIGAEYRWGDWFAVAAGRYVGARTVYSLSNTEYRRSTSPFGLALTELDDYAALDLAVGWHRRGPDGRSQFARLSVFDVFDSSHYESYPVQQGVLMWDNEEQYGSEIGRQIAGAIGFTF